MWKVYILKCVDGSYYTGLTKDIEARISAHNEGKGSIHTKNRRPVNLKYFEEFDSKNDALKREKEIKKFRRVSKEHLIKYGLGSRVY